MFEIADPEGSRFVTAPAAADLLGRDAQLAPRGPLAAKMAVELAPRDLPAELLLKDSIDDLIGAARLLVLQLHGTGEQVGVAAPRLAPIRAPAAIQSRHPVLLELPPFPPQGANRQATPPPIRQQSFLPTQLVEVPLALTVGNLFQQQGAQQRAPEDRPGFIVTTHRVSSL
jgi:hypothetical protein